MQKIRFLPLLCVLLMLFTAPTLLAQQEPDTPYPAETMLSVRMMPPGERSLRNFLYPKLMAQEASIQLPAGTSYNLLVQTLDNMRNDYPELFHIESYRVHYQRNQPDVAQSISPRYLCSAEEASALRKQLLETAQSWVDENPDPLALYERLVQNTTYSPDSMWQHAAVGALLYGEATCAGYAQAISLLYRLAGIPCATIIGEASDTSGETGLHAWNVTNFGFLDATWGAAFDGHVFHSNYAMGEADMSIDHTPNRGYTFPDLSGVPNYYQAHGLYVSTEQELLTQLMRLVDGETVEIQLSPDLYARYTAAMKDKPFYYQDNRALHERKMNEAARLEISRRNIEFILEHQKDSAAELANYLRRCQGWGTSRRSRKSSAAICWPFASARGSTRWHTAAFRSALARP